MTNSLLRDAICAMENAADALRDLHRQVTVPQDEYTLTEAYQRIAALLPDDCHWGLDIQVSRDQDGSPRVRYRLFDGEQSCVATTLAGVLNSLLAKHSPKRADPPEPLVEAASLIEKAVSLPF